MARPARSTSAANRTLSTRLTPEEVERWLEVRESLGRVGDADALRALIDASYKRLKAPLEAERVGASGFVPAPAPAPTCWWLREGALSNAAFELARELWRVTGKVNDWRGADTMEIRMMIGADKPDTLARMCMALDEGIQRKVVQRDRLGQYFVAKKPRRKDFTSPMPTGAGARGSGAAP